MQIKLLAFDLDGTALVNHRILPDRTRAALIAAGERGVLLVPATGRINSFLPEPVLSLPHVRYAITANGGGVYDLREGRALHSACISTDKALRVQAVLDEYPLYTEYYVGGSAYGLRCTPEEAVKRFGLPESKLYFLTKTYTYTSSFYDLLRHTGEPVEKINLPFIPDRYRAELRTRLGEIPGLCLTSSIPDNLEINDHTATKGQGLAALCRLFAIAPEACMAVGDNGNDTDMLRFAGVSVAMGNSSAEAFAAARHRTLRCDEDGLGLAIEQFILA